MEKPQSATKVVKRNSILWCGSSPSKRPVKIQQMTWSCLTQKTQTASGLSSWGHLVLAARPGTPRGESDGDVHYGVTSD
ncbi:unnamed protein product [Phytophthora lilii]|uniref:Unnamed protein product n=1 Tax=Phytophthora lilii TaxID=2077276 RepID=A0A9W6XFH4_9STRA|nr:unnamed protein product [Phytophthora lilii]